jgi:hypothetical protein
VPQIAAAGRVDHLSRPVLPLHQAATSWEGNNDTSSREKDIITIVHITYELR